MRMIKSLLFVLVGCYASAMALEVAEHTLIAPAPAVAEAAVAAPATVSVDAIMNVIKTEVVDKYADYMNAAQAGSSDMESKLNLATDEIEAVMNSLDAYKEFKSVALRGLFVEFAADIKSLMAEAAEALKSLNGDGAEVEGDASHRPSFAQLIGYLYYNRKVSGATFSQTDKDAATRFIKDGFDPVQTVPLRLAIFRDLLASPSVSIEQIDDVIKRTQDEIDKVAGNLQTAIESHKGAETPKVATLKKHHERLTAHKTHKTKK